MICKYKIIKLNKDEKWNVQVAASPGRQKDMSTPEKKNYNKSIFLPLAIDFFVNCYFFIWNIKITII